MRYTALIIAGVVAHTATPPTTRVTVCNDGSFVASCTNPSVIDAGTDILDRIATVEVDGYRVATTNVWLADADGDCTGVGVYCYSSMGTDTRWAQLSHIDGSDVVIDEGILISRTDALQGVSLRYDVSGYRYFRCWYNLVGVCSGGDSVTAEWGLAP